MSRKRLTQVFPFLLPLRKWQRKKFFYYKMRKDGCFYAKKTADNLLPNLVFEASIPMLNEKSGFEMKYQVNKVHNLKLASRTINHVVIQPDETFSFWQLVRWADSQEKYKDGLNLVNGKIVASYGGGLCMLSDTLFWMFLHTPLTIVERHGHAVKSFPETTEAIATGMNAAEVLPAGVDATVVEGWLDLKVRNDTDNTFQIELDFDDKYMHGRILSKEAIGITYSVFNSSVSYKRQGGRIYQTASVCRTETDKRTGRQRETELYINKCEIAYSLPDGINIEEGDK
ncbi:MAG: glycopeptide resistance accessory protein VanW [Lachnospiraceae bacterium]|nr:glycopeptide resistance accessory protein VanW [Lachnospiraceae bacterium]